MPNCSLARPSHPDKARKFESASECTRVSWRNQYTCAGASADDETQGEAPMRNLPVHTAQLKTTDCLSHVSPAGRHGYQPLAGRSPAPGPACYRSARSGFFTRWRSPPPLALALRFRFSPLMKKPPYHGANREGGYAQNRRKTVPSGAAIIFRLSAAGMFAAERRWQPCIARKRHRSAVAVPRPMPKR